MRNTRQAFGDAPAYFPVELMITPRAPRLQDEPQAGSARPGVTGSLLKGAGKAAGKVFTRGKGKDTQAGHRRMLDR